VAGNLDLIDTIIILILENRSFDHVLGYLSRGSGGLPVEGIRDDPAWLAQHANSWNGKAYPPHPISRMSFVDPPHGSRAIADQIGRVRAGATPPMDGFVKVYANGNPKPDDPGLVMGHYTAAEVPMYDFLARNYSVCDHWFAALPAGTQPNKLMAMSGTTSVVDNAPALLPDQPLVYDWLTDHRVRWCVYQSGDYFPFFTLMPAWIGEIATSLAGDQLGARGHFRRLKHFPDDWKTSTMPQVIFIEPEYSDGPHESPNDDHPPTAISRGQALVRDIYAALIANPARWQRTMMIVTYDEHGGFYDHVAPLPIVTDVKTSTGFLVRLSTSGVRVPALVLSPLVEPGSVHARPLDHTALLQLLADKFDGGRPYSDAVARRQPWLSPLSAVLTRSAPRTQAAPAPVLAAPPAAVMAAGAADRYPRDRTSNDNSKAMRLAAARMVADHPELVQHGLQRIAAAADRGDTAFA
jgi:phospholipase C